MNTNTNVDTLRPATFDQYHGQPKLKERITVRIAAAIAQERPLDHILLAGPPGSGKTTLATIISVLSGDHFMSLIMPVSDKVLEEIVRDFNGILLLDELHSAPKAFQERLLPLLEFGYLSTSRGVRIENPWLTIIGATTEPEAITPALRRRFRFRPVWEEYSPSDLSAIVTGMLDKVELDLCLKTVAILGEAAGGLPHMAGELVLGARDLAAINVGEPSAEDILDHCGVTADGLSEDHLRYLQILKDLNGTAGLTQLATSLRLHEKVCRELERLLLSRKLIALGERGRELTTIGHRRFKTTGRSIHAA